MVSEIDGIGKAVVVVDHCVKKGPANLDVNIEEGTVELEMCNLYLCWDIVEVHETKCSILVCATPCDNFEPARSLANSHVPKLTVLITGYNFNPEHPCGWITAWGCGTYFAGKVTVDLD